MPHFKAFNMMNIIIWQKILNKVTKTSQDNNLLKHFNEYLTEK